MKKAEKVAEAWVNTLWKDLVEPGKYAGPNMDANTFDIEDFVDAQISLSYPGKVPDADRKLARETARRLWDAKVSERGKPAGKAAPAVFGYHVTEDRGRNGTFCRNLPEALAEAKERMLRGETVFIAPNIK